MEEIYEKKNLSEICLLYFASSRLSVMPAGLFLALLGISGPLGTRSLKHGTKAEEYA
jgi:hypothetical protein